MSALSDYLENKLIDLLFRGQAFTAPVTVYVALFTCTKGIRANSTAYALNDTLAVLANDGKYHYYKCTTANPTAAAQGTLYPGAPNEIITDGTAVMTEQSSVMDANGGVEVSGGSYARVAVAGSLANFAGTQAAASVLASTGTGGTTSNNTVLTFPAPTANWASALNMAWGFGFYDAATVGNLLTWGALATPRNINNGDLAPSAAIGALTFQIDN